MIDDDRSPGDVIISRMEDLVSTALRKQYSRESDTWDPFGEPGYHKSVRDSKYHFSYLAESMKVDSPELFKDYVAWVKVLFTGLGFPHEVPINTLKCMLHSIREHLDDATVCTASRYFEEAMEHLSFVSETTSSHIPRDSVEGKLASQYLTLILSSDGQGAEELIFNALDKGTDLRDIFLKVLQPCQYEIGRLWQLNRVSVAEEHYATAITKRIISRIYPRALSNDAVRVGRKAVAAAIDNELHEMGIRMVADFLEMEGWDTLFLGANTPSRVIVRACCDFDADLLCISTTISFHVGQVKELIEKVRVSKPVNWLKVMVGGYPFNLDPELWRKVGADGYARDAAEAVGVALMLTGGSKE